MVTHWLKVWINSVLFSWVSMREGVHSIPGHHYHPVPSEGWVLLRVDESRNTSKVVIWYYTLSHHIHFIVHLTVQTCVNIGPIGSYKISKVDLSISGREGFRYILTKISAKGENSICTNLKKCYENIIIVVWVSASDVDNITVSLSYISSWMVVRTKWKPISWNSDGNGAVLAGW